MRKNSLEKLDLYFLPSPIREKVKLTLDSALKTLKKIKWPIEAIVLGGGFKHGEVAFTEKGLISDIDLYLFSNFISLFWKKAERIEKEIKEKVPLSFDLHGVIPLFLFKSRTYWAYRLKNQGIVLDGDGKVLEKIRATENNIPKIEAVRILFWNLALWLSSPSNPQRILRSYLNLGESYLTFAKKLTPSFKERAKRIDEVARELNLDQKLLKKIKLSYETRMGQIKEKIGENLTLEQARKDCLFVIDQQLSLFLKKEGSLEEKLDLLASKLSPNFFINFFFYFFVKKIKEIKPNLLPIVFKFKITDLWKITAFQAMADYKKRDAVLNKFFSFKDFSDKILVKIYQSYRLPSVMEIT